MDSYMYESIDSVVETFDNIIARNSKLNVHL